MWRPQSGSMSPRAPFPPPTKTDGPGWENDPAIGFPAFPVLRNRLSRQGESSVEALTTLVRRSRHGEQISGASLPRVLESQ